ncbi:hypothetical protein [Streptomyces sp. NPDC003247]|uniref:hypothetical protein n=1 Tax=Streptomyces sp. NPDC003247 TaxID=3364677 RepID=UPI0036BEFA2E
MASRRRPTPHGLGPLRHTRADAPGPWTHHVVPDAGHDLPQERPEAFTAAVLEADAMT